MSRALIVTTVGLCLAVTGCGAAGQNSDQQMVRTGRLTPTVKANGLLSSAPALLTLADVNAQPAGSPQRVVMGLLFWTQWGSIPEIFAAYDPSVLNVVGTGNVAGAFGSLRPQLLTDQVKIGRVVTHGTTCTVLVRLRSSLYPANRDSFTLRREHGDWVIVYDTLLDRGLVGYLFSINPTLANGAPTLATRTATNAVVMRYRSAFTRIAGK